MKRLLTSILLLASLLGCNGNPVGPTSSGDDATVATPVADDTCGPKEYTRAQCPPVIRPIPPAPTPAPPAGRTARPGLVVGAGNDFVDGRGKFYPLGETLFWVLRGFHAGGDERARAQKNIDFVAQQDFDYIRVLGQVDWAGLEIRPDWPDYEANLGDLIDYAYAQGLRVQLTLFGGGSYDVDLTLQKVQRVLVGREEKIFFLEVVNEQESNWDGSRNALLATAIDVHRFFPGLYVPSRYANNVGVSRSWVDSGAANMITDHFDRQDNTVEWKWRSVRQAWASRGNQVPSAQNEPCGPRSSVAQCEEPIHLVMTRATGILVGYSAYTLHNGAGIYGVPQAGNGGRPANLWEIPGIVDTMRILRNLERILPPDANLGQPTRQGLGPHPFGADAFIESSGRGVVRDYASVRSDGFWQVLLGVKDYVRMTADDNYSIDFYNPLDGSLVRTELVAKGQTIRVEPRGAVDSRGWGAYIVRGIRR